MICEEKEIFGCSLVTGFLQNCWCDSYFPPSFLNFRFPCPVFLIDESWSEFVLIDFCSFTTTQTHKVKIHLEKVPLPANCKLALVFPTLNLRDSLQQFWGMQLCNVLAKQRNSPHWMHATVFSDRKQNDIFPKKSVKLINHLQVTKNVSFCLHLQCCFLSTFVLLTCFFAFIFHFLL